MKFRWGNHLQTIQLLQDLPELDKTGLKITVIQPFPQLTEPLEDLNSFWFQQRNDCKFATLAY
jgi:hypothetical protein